MSWCSIKERLFTRAVCTGSERANKSKDDGMASPGKMRGRTGAQYRSNFPFLKSPVGSIIKDPLCSSLNKMLTGTVLVCCLFIVFRGIGPSVLPLINWKQTVDGNFRI